MKMKPFISFLMVSALIVLLLGPCAINMAHGELNYDPEISAPDQYSDDGIWYCNRFASAGTPPFPLPEAAAYPGGNEYAYTGVSRAYYDSFLSGLTADGFSLVRMKYSDFLFRDDCMVFSNYREDDGFFSAEWYRENPCAPKEGISYEEAASLILPDRDESLSPIPVHPVDITPDGFYDRTGGQIFAVPYYSYDSYRRSGYHDLLFEDNERYGCVVYYVNGDQFHALSMECIAVCDVDSDGSNEVLLLSHGPTSGVFTFIVTCITGQDAYNSTFCTEFYRLGFSGKDGKAVIEGVGYDSSQHFFDILLEKHNGEKIVMLYEDGKSLQVPWTPDKGNK